MKITSKSILSPGRAGVRDPPNSLSNSLSRRLRNSGSIKGGASPAMFPTAAKKRGSFENAEPSSPKVTCIGQVRVKGRKKQAKKLKSLSRRHSLNEVSFRKSDQTLNGFSSKSQTYKESLNLGSKGSQNYPQSQNQECSPAAVQRSWAHFPVTICDALRAFGSEFSCLFPCRKEEKMVVVEDGNRQGSCGVFARWLVAVQDGDGGGRRDIELVVGEEEDIEEDECVRKTRRHVFEDLEIVNDRIEGHKDEARVSICIPPKNALLLMRCRSDPVKIEALTNRSWEPNVATNDEEDKQLVENENQNQDLELEQQQIMILDQENIQQVEAIQNEDQEHVLQDEVGQDQKHGNVRKDEIGQDQEHETVQKDEVGEDQQLEIVQKDEVGQDQQLEIVQKDEVGQDQKHKFMQKDEVGRDQKHEFMQKDEVGQDQDKEKIEEEEESFYLVTLFEEFMNHDYETEEMMTEFAEISETHDEILVIESEEVNNGVLEGASEKLLPECLLMMMYEPKLSMEVSRETWVCSKDFIRRNSSKRKPPPMPVPVSVNADGGDESKVTATANGTTFAYDVMRVAEPMLQQPARSSCSFPAMATMLEEKLANAVGYEPFVLTRCKSEPMKSAAAKLLPESCVWENRKLERMSRGTFAVEAAGLGF